MPMEDNVADGSSNRSKPGTLSFETEPNTQNFDRLVRGRWPNALTQAESEAPAPVVGASSPWDCASWADRWVDGSCPTAAIPVFVP